MQTVSIDRGAAAIDLAIAIALFLAGAAAEPTLDPILRRGYGLIGAVEAAAYQFTLEGLAVLFIMAIRHERFSDYGLIRLNLGKSVALAVVLAALYNLAMSWHAGALLWIPPAPAAGD